MKDLIIKTAITVFVFVALCFPLNAQQRNDLVGYWVSAQRNVIIKIYSDSPHFKGAVIWFDASDDVSRPMNTRKDIKNPNKNLRERKIIGIDVLQGLTFNPKCKCWQNGKIYDVQTGKTWSANLNLENINKVKVRGFWHYEFIGKSMVFRRMK